MSQLALMLVLISAVAHATWNLIAKHVAGGLAFQWLFTVLSAVIYAPAIGMLMLAGQTQFTGIALVFMAGTAALHLVYFSLLSRGYQVGELSLVYPLARGSGPFMATVGAIVLRGERPTPIALGGAVLVGTGIVLLTGNPRALRHANVRTAIGYALLAGLTIASYTVWDKDAVTNARLSPMFYYWSATAMQALLLTPYMLRSQSSRAVVRIMWKAHRGAATGIAVLSPLAYVLVLTALSTTPVYYVAPIREVGILFGAVLGSHMFAEGDRMRRLIAAAILVAGVVVLAVS